MKRYYTYSTFLKILSDVCSLDHNEGITTEVIGNSVLGKPIKAIKIGTGKTRVLLWSQMHGNESSTTRAIISLLKEGKFNSFYNSLSLYIIPVLNPDGAQLWSRNNANDIDLNRDAKNLSQPESQILNSVFKQFKPDYCFNLHGQRTIYGSVDGNKAAQVSFLAPAGDLDRTVTTVRLLAMDLINEICDNLQLGEDVFVGRYSDAFNDNCVGDFFTQQGVPTVLFEAGHAGKDYSRDEVTLHMSASIVVALNTIVAHKEGRSNVLIKKEVLDRYESINPIATSFCDILIRNMPSHKGARVDLVVMYREVVFEDSLFFIPCVMSINDPLVTNAHRVIDLKEYDHDSIDIIIAENGVISSTTFEIKKFCE